MLVIADVSAEVTELVDLGERLLDGAGRLVGAIMSGITAADVISDVGPRLFGTGAVRTDDVPGRRLDFEPFVGGVAWV